MKTKEELNALKNEVEALKAKLAELTDEEMEQVSGGHNYFCDVRFLTDDNNGDTLLIDPVKD